jgi:hypothetical protein
MIRFLFIIRPSLIRRRAQAATGIKKTPSRTPAMGLKDQATKSNLNRRAGWKQRD